MTIMTTKVERWLHTELPNGRTREDELRDLFLELESILEKKNLLRRDYKRFKTLHFAEFCHEIFSHTEWIYEN